ncbi:MAG: hypothetical protein GY810_14355 [Aureispira sp.]|nr:hypothetical protein [Aureispira sp.]
MIDALGGTTERFYYNSFSYVEFRFGVEEPVATFFLETPKQLLKRNTKGYFDYHFIHGMNVFTEKTAVHLLSPKNNAVLFDSKIGLFEKLYTQVQTKQIDAYTNSTLDTVFEASVLAPIIPNNYKLIGYKMKEVSFFDTHRFIKESRILSLCPLVVDKENPTDTIELFWLYYPSIRELLATIKTSSPNNPHIQHIDDLFFFQDFDAQLFSEISYSGQKTTPSKIRAKETERFKLDWLQLEHDCWQYFAWPSDDY